MSTHLKIPYATPTWLTPQRILYPTMLIFIVCATLPVVGQINLARDEIRRATIGTSVLIINTALLSWLLLWRALKARSFDRTLLWCIFVAMPLGALNSGLSEGIITLYHSKDAGQTISAFFLALLLGGFIAAPIGLVYGILYSIITGATKRALMYPSHDGPDRVMLIAGLWLSIIGALISALPSTSLPLFLSPLWMIWIGIPMAAIALYRWAGRKLWYSKVLRDADPRYKIKEPEDDDPAAFPQLRYLFRAEPPLDGNINLLMYIPPAKDIAYRDIERMVPVGIVGVKRPLP